jgi:uncharacterized DUF497 family protein
MSFEFDPAKSATNREKHGIDLAAAQAVWSDARRLEIRRLGPDAVEPKRIKYKKFAR